MDTLYTLKAGHCFACQLQALIDLCQLTACHFSLGLIEPYLACRGFQFTLGALAEPHIGSTLPRLQLNAGAISLSMGGSGKMAVAAQGLTAHAFKVSVPPSVSRQCCDPYQPTDHAESGASICCQQLLGHSAAADARLDHPDSGPAQSCSPSQDCLQAYGRVEDLECNLVEGAT